MGFVYTAAARNRDARNKELYERLFPELRTKREQMEKFSRSLTVCLFCFVSGIFCKNDDDVLWH